MSTKRKKLKSNLKKYGEIVYQFIKILLRLLEVVIPLRWFTAEFARFNDWLFGKGTRVVEFINSALLIGFTLPFVYNLESMLESSVYHNFQFASNPMWLLLMLILGILQSMAMLRKSVQSNQVSGYLLIISGWVWGLVSSVFISNSPPVTTAPVVYCIIAFVCTVAGLYLLKHNKKLEDMIHRGD